MPAKNVLVIIRSPPHTTLNTYEGLRVAAGLSDHNVKILYMDMGIYSVLKTSDHSLSFPFMADLPEMGTELYVDAQALNKHDIKEEDLISVIKVATKDQIQTMIEETEASLVF